MNSPSRADEHLRFTHYLTVLMQVPDADAPVLVAAILCDPDQTMAQAAVVWYLDLRATALRQEPEFPAWAQKMADVMDRQPFAAQRLREWSLFRAITLALPWNADALIAASDWLQHKVAGSETSPEALVVLAEAGRTRRIRHIAKVSSRLR